LTEIGLAELQDKDVVLKLNAPWEEVVDITRRVPDSALDADCIGDSLSGVQRLDLVSELPCLPWAACRLLAGFMLAREGRHGVQWDSQGLSAFLTIR
jgi:hypothetical protein